jgi:protein-L-isoaspartate O-methyltransferase
MDFAAARRNMVESQLRTNQVTEAAVLAAMGDLPRERFVPERLHMDQAGGAHGRDERLAVEHLADSVAIAVGMVRRAGVPAETN